eukprot:SAG31_NODE_4360_length_3312_cov_2.190787_2_plen_235_part_00
MTHVSAPSCTGTACRNTLMSQLWCLMAGDPYETLVFHNIVMNNLNETYDPYDPGAGQLPDQTEWNELFNICAKMHAQYWNDATVQKPPLSVDSTGGFKLTQLEEDLALSVGPAKIVEGWEDACKTHMLPRAGQEAYDLACKCFETANLWKGENGATIFRAAMARLVAAPSTLVHGDVNPGNIWKTKLGKTGDDKYCFADWQIVRIAPAAWEFATPQVRSCQFLLTIAKPCLNQD